MKNISLILFIILVVGIGWIIGFLNIPGEWYAHLTKPVFNPPNWGFGPVWTLLYILIAIAGWRTWQKESYSRALSIWLLQMGLNFVWSPVFFSLHHLEVALMIIMLLLISIALFITNRWNDDRISALLFMPYAAWVAFAGLLNLSLVILN